MALGLALNPPDARSWLTRSARGETEARRNAGAVTLSARHVGACSREARSRRAGTAARPRDCTIGPQTPGGEHEEPRTQMGKLRPGEREGYTQGQTQARHAT